MKKVLYVVGAGLVIGGAVIVIFLLNNKKKEQGHDEDSDCKEQDRKQSPVEDVSLAEVVSAQEETKYDDVKSSAIGNMYSRHEEAATIIKDSVDTIRENVKVSADSNNEIDEVSAELDRMLKED